MALLCIWATTKKKFVQKIDYNILPKKIDQNYFEKVKKRLAE